MIMEIGFYLNTHSQEQNVGCFWLYNHVLFFWGGGDQYILPNPESIYKQDIQRDHLMEGRQQADVSYMRCMQEVVSLNINE